MLLYEARTNGGLKVVACSDVAASTGVRIEMPLAEALALVDGDFKSQISNLKSQISNFKSQISHPLRVEAHDPIADRQTLEELAVWCQQFSPIVSLEDASRPESLLLDLTGIGSLFGGEAALISRIERVFTERGLAIRIAVAETIGAAWALAHYEDESQISNLKSQIQDFKSQISNLKSLPVPALRLPVETVTCLEELGIYRIEQLVQLPRETLSSRFGPQLLLRLDQAMGLIPEAILAHKPPPEFEVEWCLEHATDRQEMIDFVLESLIARLTHQLAERREGVVRLECRLDLQTGEPVQFSVGLYRASAAAKHLLGLIHLQMEKIRLGAAVSAIRLTATATGPLEMEQQALFAEERWASPRHLAALVDRLASRLGREAVLRPTTLADAQPEYACQYLPLAGQVNGRGRGGERKRRSSKAKSSPTHPLSHSPTPPFRPLQLSAPVALEVMAIAPEGPPIHFRACGCEQRVVNVWGPERIETGWWRNRGVRRDYYRVETHTGQRFWLFRRLGDERWFWHGVFE